MHCPCPVQGLQLSQQRPLQIQDVQAERVESVRRAASEEVLPISARRGGPGGRRGGQVQEGRVVKAQEEEAL